jgi:hypothetical protein
VALWRAIRNAGLAMENQLSGDRHRLFLVATRQNNWDSGLERRGPFFDRRRVGIEFTQLSHEPAGGFGGAVSARGDGERRHALCKLPKITRPRFAVGAFSLSSTAQRTL